MFKEQQKDSELGVESEMGRVAGDDARKVARTQTTESLVGHC